ncbi:MAG: hypothetical protein ACK5HA_12940 [Planctomycetaceae bacterium]|jgi:hypothetical protein
MPGWLRERWSVGVFTLLAMGGMLSGGSCLWAADEPAPVAERENRKLVGWTVKVSRELLEKSPRETEQALKLLEQQLEEVVRVVPARAVTELRKVPLWISPEYAGVAPRAEYHPGADWLRKNQRDPAMEKGVEFTNVRIFEAETRRMPNFALHELAHAYHDRVLPGGFDNAPLKAAFDEAKKGGRYEKVEQRFGDGRSAQARAYALSNPAEYFAECSEAYFSKNDFYPFDREQLREHDPRMCELLERLWGEPDDQ